MKIRIELTEQDLKALILDHIRERMNADFNPDHVKIEVKSKQNYKSEWETANFRAIYEQI